MDTIYTVPQYINTLNFPREYFRGLSCEKVENGFKLHIILEDSPEYPCAAYIKYFFHNCGIGVLSNLTEIDMQSVPMLDYLLNIMEQVSLMMKHTVAIYTTNKLNSNLVKTLLKREYIEIYNFMNNNGGRLNHIFVKNMRNV